jgi:putative phosphoribosyl transferase
MLEAPEKLFQDRRHAGRLLAAQLSRYAHRPDVAVLGLPRGGVPVAYEVAEALDAPLDVFVVRKLGVPGRSELAMGALASGGVRVLNHDVVSMLGIPESAVARAVAAELVELARRDAAYRGPRAPLDVADRVGILIDDGLATGATMRAAVAGLRLRGPARIVVAVPVAAAQTCDELAEEVDDLVCAVTPEPFRAVGMWYADFSQTDDDEVRDLLDAADRRWRETAAPGARTA